MTEQRAQKLWKIYCDELIDNGDKTSEDVRQALATVIRKIVSDYEDWKDGTYMVNSIHLLDFACELENLK
jgi:hypothetical protein